MSSHQEDLEAIRTVVQRTAALLDTEQFSEWISLFDAEGSYELAAYSTEIRRWMTWQLSDRPALKQMLDEVGEHVRDPARRRHVVGMPFVEFTDDATARATTTFSLFRTTPEGTSSLYIVGSYEDQFIKRDGAWRYAFHRVVSDTRVLDAFTHIPV
ncbi:nuclear transport factor 2 family protein [Bradyrhizobium sp. Ai1a-2]|uniref:nuclear transport factor 2 family protein n=1 Tax=Bradyrhizobium sp. Ai1a-2 TaxID=196490 RepID=UPI00047F7170|nr:nuclear transport factor 2 family protein [Bradyrhizobium sp. Ai1a-2]